MHTPYNNGCFSEGDSRNIIPTIEHESLGLAVDLIKGIPRTESSTALSLLVRSDGPVEIEALAGYLRQSTETVDWTINVLQEAGFCERIVIDGITQVVATAPETEAQ